MIKIFRIISVLLLIGWSIMIFCLSAETAETSSETSGGFVTAIINILFPDYEKLSEAELLALREQLQFIIRKTAHFTIYAILGMLSFLCVITYKKIPFFCRLGSASAFCLLYAVSDELHQLAVAGRSGEVRDVLIDFCGALLGIAFIALLTKILKFKFIKKYT